MNALLMMERAAVQFADRLRLVPGAIERHVPDYAPSTETLQWTNVLLESGKFRHGHVETFVVAERLSVLHVCLFPHLDDPGPIFGFDMIAGPARVTGIFLDLSPTTGQAAGLGLGEVRATQDLGEFQHPRVLPDWGDIFSAECLAIRPADLDEVARAIRLAQAALDACLTVPRVRAPHRSAEIGAGQARYIAAQRRNEHTYRMLAGLIGQDKARGFIDEVLFPDVPELAV
jgi:phycocyanobilin:ferredoxin oxidoreductase